MRQIIQDLAQILRLFSHDGFGLRWEEITTEDSTRIKHLGDEANINPSAISLLPSHQSKAYGRRLKL